MTSKYPVSRPHAKPSKNASQGRARPLPTARLTPVSWLFVVVAIVLIGVLTYYLTLTTRPEIAQISPAPNSSLVPGPVQLEALINSQRDLEEVRFYIDGEPVSPTLEHNGDNEWLAYHEQVFERGQRTVLLEVVDESGRTAEHTWTFESGGELVPPRLSLASPPSGLIVEAGDNGIRVQATTFADIGDVIVEIDGERSLARINEADASSEYTAENGLPIYDWDISARGELEAGTVEVHVIVTDVHGASSNQEWTVEVSDSPADAEARFFPVTGEYAIQPFLSFWEENDGEMVFGPPVSPPLVTEDGHEHQYFRYARLELDNSGNVQLGLLGREIFGDPETPPDRPPGDAARLFDPTGHYIYGVIREFWEENGGLSVFGYPLSQEFDTTDGYAQYFERALIEVIEGNGDEEVQLAPLGEQVYEERQRGERPSAPEEEDDDG